MTSKAMVAATAVLLLLPVGCRRRQPSPTPRPAPSTIPDAARGSRPPAADLRASSPAPTSFAPHVRRLAPSVVAIHARHRTRIGPSDRAPGPLPTDDTRLGSGWLLDPSGQVVTQASLLGSASEIWVTIGTYPSLRATLVGLDETLDVALLKVTPSPGMTVTPIPLGDSDPPDPGEWVLALGNPLGLGIHVTPGVVCSSPSTLPAAPGPRPIEGLQVSPAPDLAAAGGPLCALEGQAVGLVLHRPGATSGLVLPIQRVKDAIARIQAKPSNRRSLLGLVVERVTPEVAATAGLDRPRGARVVSLIPDGPAARAGLKPGDIILALDGQAIEHAEAMPALTARLGPAQALTLVVQRGGQPLPLSIQTAAAP